MLLSVAKALLSAALLVLPGYLTRLAWPRRTPPSAPPDALAFWGEALLFGVLWMGGWGVVLAQVGWFSLGALWLLSAGYSGALGVWLWRRGGSLRPHLALDRREGAAFLLLMLAAALLFFHPHEFIWGGADAGVYVNLGANISRTGSWRIQEPLIAEMAPELYPGMFREQPAPMIPQYIPLPGTYLTDAATGQVTPQFFPLFPVWVAILYSIGGLELGLYATPLWGWLGCAMVYLAGRALLGRRVGLMGAALLACTATQIWFSRYPTSETLTQMLLFAGIYAFTLHLEHGERSPWWGALAGLALGQALLSRIDLYVLCLLPVGYALYLRFRRLPRRLFWAFSLPFGALGGYSLLFARLDSWPYFYNVYGSFLDLSAPLAWLPYAVAGLLALALAWLAAGWLSPHRDRAWAASAGRWALRSAAVAIVLLAAYAYFLRPVVEQSGGSYYYWYGDHQVPYVEPYNLVRLGWYLTPLGLLLATGGVFLVLWRGFHRRLALPLALGLLFTVFFVYNSRNNPHQIYVMRRYVPVVIPFLMLMAAYGLDRLASLPRRGGALAGALAAVLVVWLLFSARTVIRHVEYRGLIPQFRALAAALGDGPTVLLFNDVRPVGPAASVGTPLRYLEGLAVFDLQEDRLDPALLLEQIRRWQAEGYRVLMVEGEQAAPLLPAEMEPAVKGYWACHYPMLETSYEHAPHQIWEITIPLWYWAVPALSPVSDALISSGGAAWAVG